MQKLQDWIEKVGLDLTGSKLTLDSGFYSKENKKSIKEVSLTLMIHPNRRNIKKPVPIAQMYHWFDRVTCKHRFCVERCFSWQDVYRRLVVTYGRLKAAHYGFRCLAYAMMNLRNSL